VRDGVHLTLMIGPAVPTPVPREVLDALISVQVSSGKERGGFQLVFSTGKASRLLTTLLPAGYLDPILTRVIIMVTVRGVPQVLMDGVVTQHSVAPAAEPGRSTMTVTGEDLSVLMDLVEMPFMRYPAMPEIAQLYAILAKYAVFGVVPLVMPPVIPDTSTVQEKIATHTGTDLEYIRQHARRCGYVFYLEPGPAPGTSIAYFGPDVRIPVPQPALNVNMDAQTNVDSLSFSLDGMSKKFVVLTVLDPVTKKIPIPIPVPELSLLRPQLGARLPIPAKVEFEQEATKLSLGEAAKRALGISFAAGDSVSGSGSLDVLRYGRVLRSRMLVGVRGAGRAYDGLYYVNNVTHDIKRGEYKQSFNLSRDGLVSLTPAVVP
jgi:hypothetical protein